jgi:hypothetical protein
MMTGVRGAEGYLETKLGDDGDGRLFNLSLANFHLHSNSMRGQRTGQGRGRGPLSIPEGTPLPMKKGKRYLNPLTCNNCKQFPLHINHHRHRGNGERGGEGGEGPIVQDGIAQHSHSRS